MSFVHNFKFYENSVPLSDDNSGAIPILVTDDDKVLSNYLSQSDKRYVSSTGFFSLKTSTVLIPDEVGNLKIVILKPSKKQRFLTGKRLACLPDGKYQIINDLSKDYAFEVTLGFCLSLYKFQKLKKHKEISNLILCIPKNVEGEKIRAFSRAEFFVRNLVNCPASHLGPSNLESVIRIFAYQKGLLFQTLVGDKLLEANFPMIHAVGRAGSEAPRLVELSWGNPNNYKVTLIGKGVCFDTGGLNLKLGASMGIMKKDMGGAASVLGLADCIVSLNLKVSLRVLIPIVENSISSQSIRPGDVLISRKGLSVEVNNTDAEGRLILADTLQYADERASDLLICLATLTGSARIALGPDIVPFFSTDNQFAAILEKGSKSICDPVWRLPFHKGYENMIEPMVADLDNAPKSGMAGSITAALFLKRFVENANVFLHCDMFCWSETTRPGRPQGGLMQGVRAIFAAIEEKLFKN